MTADSGAAAAELERGRSAVVPSGQQFALSAGAHEVILVEVGGGILGATFHTGPVADIGVTPDVVIECTGHGPLVFELAGIVAPDAVICLTGISSGTRTVNLGLDQLNKEMVLENTVLFGSVNAGRRHYQQAADALAAADRGWLERLLTRRVPMSGFADALHKNDDDVKVVVDLTA